MNGQILLILDSNDGPEATAQAIAHAREHGKKLAVLLLITSHLYHYGHTDPIVNGFSRSSFVSHILNNQMETGRRQAVELLKEAERAGVEIEIRPVPTEDPAAVALAESRKDYEAVFVRKPGKRLLPLFQSDPARVVIKKSGKTVIGC